MATTPQLPDRLLEAIDDLPADLEPDNVWLSRRAHVAWSMYLIIAAAVDTKVIASLLTPNALDQARRRFPEASPSSGDDATVWIEEHIRDWCEEWGFLYHFARLAANNTIGDAARAADQGESLPSTFTHDTHGQPFNASQDIFQVTRVEVGVPEFLDPAFFIPAAVGSLDGRPVVFEIWRGEPLWIDVNELHWDARNESRKEARKRILDHLRREVDAELDRIQGEQESRGYRQVPRRRVSGERLAADIWIFARHRIGDESLADIERTIGVGEPWRPHEAIHKEVLRAVERAEQILGIPRR